MPLAGWTGIAESAGSPSVIPLGESEQRRIEPPQPSDASARRYPAPSPGQGRQNPFAANTRSTEAATCAPDSSPLSTARWSRSTTAPTSLCPEENNA